MQLLPKLFLPSSGQLLLEFRRQVEMVLDGRLSPPGYENHQSGYRKRKLLQPHTAPRLIHDGKHFLGLRFGGWQESRAKPGNRQNRFPNLHGHLSVGHRSSCLHKINSLAPHSRGASKGKGLGEGPGLGERS